MALPAGNNNPEEDSIYPLKVTPIPVIIRYVTLRHLRRPSSSQFCSSNSPQAHKCKNCDFKTDLKVILRNHVRAAHVRESTSNWERTLLKNYSCKHCDFQTFSLLHLTRHWYTCKTKMERLLGQFKCQKCTLYFKRSDRLKYHVTMAHTAAKDVEWFVCAQCDFRSTYKQYLNRHVSIKHTQVSSELQCSFCDYKTKIAPYLKRHIKRRHLDGSKWQTCTLCPYKCKKGDTMERHCKIKHSSGVTTLKCKHCQCVTLTEDSGDHETHSESKEAKLLQCEIKGRLKSIMAKHKADGIE